MFNLNDNDDYDPKKQIKNYNWTTGVLLCNYLWIIAESLRHKNDNYWC